MNDKTFKKFQDLSKKGYLIKQDRGKNTCVAVVYLNLAIYLGKRPSYSQVDVQNMLNTEKISWEENIFPKLAGDGNILKNETFDSYNEFSKKLKSLVNINEIPVGYAVGIQGDDMHAIIILQISDNTDILSVHDPLRGFVELSITEKCLSREETGETFLHHPKFNIYYPKK